MSGIKLNGRQTKQMYTAVWVSLCEMGKWDLLDVLISPKLPWQHLRKYTEKLYRYSLMVSLCWFASMEDCREQILSVAQFHRDHAECSITFASAGSKDHWKKAYDAIFIRNHAKVPAVATVESACLEILAHCAQLPSSLTVWSSAVSMSFNSQIKSWL